MELAYWIVGGVLALAFFFAGVFKLVTSKEQLKAKGMNWTDQYSQRAIRGIATMEILGALGVILPPLTGTLEWLAPIAALGLFVVMLGAIRAHLKVPDTIVPNIVLAVLALATAVLGFLVWV